MEWLRELLGLDEYVDAKVEEAILGAGVSKLARQVARDVYQANNPVIGLFEDGDLQAFTRDFDATEEFRHGDGKLEGVLVNGLLRLYAEQPSDKLSNDTGIVYLVPNGVLGKDLFHYGGIGQRVVGTARMWNRDGDYALGTARWSLPHQNPSNRYAVVVEVDGEPIQHEHPWSWYYGLILHVTIPLP